MRLNLKLFGEIDEKKLRHFCVQNDKFLGCIFVLFTILFLLFSLNFLFMTKRMRITLSQVMAILALIGILLSVVGTTWISQQPVPTISPDAIISGEIPVTTELPVVQK